VGLDRQVQIGFCQHGAMRYGSGWFRYLKMYYYITLYYNDSYFTGKKQTTHKKPIW
jgi:hypothetical protein